MEGVGTVRPRVVGNVALPGYRQKIHAGKRTESFRSATKTRKALHQTFITTYGVKKNLYSGNVQSEVALDDLFVG